jgi:hypothetical protein
MEAPSMKVASPNNGQNVSTGGNLTVAGIDTNTSKKIQQPNTKTEGNSTAMPNSTVIAPILHSNSTSNSTSLKIKNNSNNDNSPKRLSVSIQSSQNVVNGRGTSTITAVAYDTTTGKKIENAVVRIKITFTSNGTSKEIVGHDGQATISAEIKPNSKDNNNISFRTTVDASAPGYRSTSKTSSSSSSISTMTYFGSHQESIINNNGSGQLTQNMLKNVQKKLERNGINFAIEK